MHASTSLLLIRHGEVEERYHNTFGGRIDMGLSPRGHAQATALARYLERQPPDAVYASPMRRAQETLTPCAPHARRAPVTRAELREVDFGDWTGLRWEEVQARYGVSAFDWLQQIEQAAIPNGESGQRVRARVEPCLREILARHAHERVAIICHGGIVRTILSLLLDLPLAKMAGFEVDYASVTRVEYRPCKTEVTLLNYAPWRDVP
ncbi:MAG TPA: histidine phosphatase family protein [Methylomirabilota bacterium]|nr:histidine phosphatase family protein [Methylomirabilota bacterium]